MLQDDGAERARQYWLAQPTETFRLGAGDLARRVARLEADARNAVVTLYIASFFNILIWGVVAIVVPGALARAGALLSLGGWVFATVQVVRGRRRTIVACLEMAELPVAAFYRDALERERVLFTGRAFWIRYLAFIAGPLVFAAGVAVAKPDGRLIALVIAVAFTAIQSLSIASRRKMAAEYQRKIDEITMYSSI